MQLHEGPREPRGDGAGERRLPGSRGPEQHDRGRRAQPGAISELGVRERRNDATVEQLLRGREPLHVLPQPRRGELTAVPLDDRQLLGHHGGGPHEEVQAVEPFEALVGERHLADLARSHESQHAMCSVVDDLLVELAEQGRTDPPVPPVRMERQGKEMRVTPCHPGQGDADDLAGRERHRRRLVLVQRLDDVAAAVGGRHGRPGQVDESNDLLGRREGVAVVQRQDTPAGRHRGR